MAIATVLHGITLEEIEENAPKTHKQLLEFCSELDPQKYPEAVLITEGKSKTLAGFDKLYKRMKRESLRKKSDKELARRMREAENIIMSMACRTSSRRRDTSGYAGDKRGRVGGVWKDVTDQDASHARHEALMKLQNDLRAALIAKDASKANEIGEQILQSGDITMIGMALGHFVARVGISDQKHNEIMLKLADVAGAYGYSEVYAVRAVAAGQDHKECVEALERDNGVSDLLLAVLVKSSEPEIKNMIVAYLVENIPTSTHSGALRSIVDLDHPQITRDMKHAAISRLGQLVKENSGAVSHVHADICLRDISVLHKDKDIRSAALAELKTVFDDAYRRHVQGDAKPKFGNNNMPDFVLLAVRRSLTDAE